MKRIVRVPSDRIRASFHDVKVKLHGQEPLIFEAMESASIAVGSFGFTPPPGPPGYAEKYNEIENRITKFTRAIDGQALAMALMVEILRRIRANGGLPGQSDTEILASMRFDTARLGGVLAMESDLSWSLNWEIRNSDGELTRRISILLNSPDLQEIVPDHVAPYLISSIEAFLLGRYAVAAALITIVFESCLRDLLAAKGITPGSPISLDVYAGTKARISVSGNTYLLSLLEATPKMPGDFVTSIGGSTLDIKIRRKQQLRTGDWDLIIKANPALLDHWSSDHVEQHASSHVEGLGVALDLARSRGFINSVIIPDDFDEVIRQIRNNLIHLSSDASNTQIKLPGIKNLEEFLNDSEMVLDLVASVANFANAIYLDIMQSHRAQAAVPTSS